MAVSPSPQRSTVSITSLIQYTLFGIIAYILAGAPYLSELSDLVHSLNPNYEDSERAGKCPFKGREGKGAPKLSYEKVDNLMIPDPNLECGEHAYKTYVLRRDPLVVYVEGFLSEGERGEVLRVSEPNYQPSTIFTNHIEHLDPSVRLSEKSPLPPSSPTIACIAERARAFQGWQPYLFIEKLWAQRYGTGGHYSYHYDYSEKRGGKSGKRSGGGSIAREGRVSTFMVYVDANCTGGGTHFPRLEAPPGRDWCRFIECEGNSSASSSSSSALSSDLDGRPDLSEGITFKPIPGNAIYWENLREDGTGYPETYHAGLPVKDGVKVGLNIWSWMQEGYDAVWMGDRASVPTKTMSVSVVAGTGETRLVEVEKEGESEG